MKNIIKIALIACLFFVGTNMVSAQKFGHLNSAELLTQLPAWKAAEKELATYSQQLENQMGSMQNEYQTKAQKLSSDIQAGIITKQQEDERTQELYGLQQEMQTFSVTAQQNVMKKEQELTAPIIENVKSSIEAVASEQGFTYIFDTSTGILLHAPDGDDVTTLVKSKLGI